MNTTKDEDADMTTQRNNKPWDHANYTPTFYVTPDKSVVLNVNYMTHAHVDHQPRDCAAYLIRIFLLGEVEHVLMFPKKEDRDLVMREIVDLVTADRARSPSRPDQEAP
jgi:hypothetical protein